MAVKFIFYFFIFIIFRPHIAESDDDLRYVRSKYYKKKINKKRILNDHKYIKQLFI